MAGAISVDEMVVRDHLAINGTMDGHLSTWLEHQGLHDHEVSFGSLLYETRDMSKINQGADNDMQLQHYRAQHFPYIDRHAQVHPHRRHNSLSVPSFAYGPPTRSAHELAWERHHYYQRLQYEEEERALRILHAKLQDQDQLSDTRHLNQDTVARASSLNRLATPSQLSKETSRILGLCRSSTISTSSTKRASVAVMESASRPASPMFDSSFDYYSNTLENEDTSGQRNGRSRPIGDTIHSEASQSEPISLATLTPTSLSRRKTLKNHLTPSLRLLARRCSTRFGSIRPYSYAGTGSDPIVEYPQGRRSSGSRSRSSSSSNGGHMCDFKPLKVGPETSEMLRQQQELHQMNQSLEHVPIKKTSSLFRSKSTRASSSDLVLSRGQVAQSETLPFPNKRNSQRSIKSLESVNTDTNSMYLDTKQYASQTAIPVSTVAYESIVNDKERESVKKQIVSIISSGWKDLRSKSSKTMLNQRPPSRTSQCLSPLAVEAQENIPEPEDQEEGFLDIKMGPGEHFSFLLVPRSEYEFQPLVAQ
ncbi:hypothetical protein BGZ46_001399 [Entomortierella lignicola]|nr:hypothetical protein BGZ46_001399 [Entomortierella lignicola]